MIKFFFLTPYHLEISTEIQINYMMTITGFKILEEGWREEKCRDRGDINKIRFTIVDN